MFNIKNLFIISVLSLSIISCGKKDDSQLSEKELKAKIANLKKQLVEIEKNDTTKKQEVKLKRVVISPVVASDFAHYIQVQGNVNSDQNVIVTPETAGRIISKTVSEGSFVKRGSVIARLDAELIRKNIQELNVRYSLAKDLFERQEALWKQKIGSEIQYLQAKNNKEALESSLATLNTQLNKTVITAPISGYIEEYMANVGEVAAPGMPVARIINLNKVKVEAEVSEVYTRNVKRGDVVSIDFPALGLERTAKVSRVGNMINPSNRTFKIEISLNNSDQALKPNSIGILKFKDFEKKNAVSISTHLIQIATNGENFIYVAEEKSGKLFAKKLFVKTGKSHDGKTIVLDGLTTSDLVITQGYSDVYSGEEVQNTEK